MHRSEANLGLRKPCANCPFLKEGAIELAPGRLEQILEDVVSNDWDTFVCHKTVHYDRDELHQDDGRYCMVGDEQQCAGATIYLLKLGRWNMRMRLGRMSGAFNPKDYEPHFGLVIDPENHS